MAAGLANAFTTADNDDIRVIIEDGDDSVRTLPGGHLAIDSPDGGVVIQLNPQRNTAPDEDADNPAKFYNNIADKIGDTRLSVIAEELFEAVSADDASRSEWLSDRAERMALLGLKLEDPSTGDGSNAVDGQSVVTNPALLDAVLRGWANAQAELLPAEGPCKIANYDPDSGEDQLAECFQDDFNYYLTSVATEFIPETQHMLLWGVYFGGCGFKKVYTHPLKKRPMSEQVQPEYLIVSDAMKDLASCERITHVITMRQSVMKKYMAKEIYRKVDLAPPTGDTSNQVAEEIASTQGTQLRKERPEDQPYILWEIQCLLDLPEFAPKQWRDSGVPLPYLVTMDKDTHEILAVRRDWKPEDEDCERKKMYVKYPYVPGPGFYGTGLAAILGNSTAALTAAWREMLDAGMFANFPAFIMDKLAGRQNTSDFRLSPGTAVGVETGNRPISDVVAQLPYKDITPGLMSFIESVQAKVEKLGGSPDIPVGEGTANIPVGTMLAHIEQASKVMGAAHKGQHHALDEELELMVDLFRENPEAFWKGLKGKTRTPKNYWNEQQLLKALNEYGLVPRSDPNVPSHIHRVMKAVALVEMADTPLGKETLDPFGVMRRALGALREDPTGLLKKPDPNPQPTPEMITAQAKAKEAETKAQKVGVDLQIANTKLPVEKMKAESGVKKSEIELARTLAANEDEQKRAEIDAQIAQGEFELKGREIESESWKREQDVQTDRMKLGVEHAKVGVQHQELQMVDQHHQDEAGLAHAQLQHQKAVDTTKAVTETAKVGIAGHAAETKRGETGIKAHQAETQRYAAENPPQPGLVKGKKKPKKGK